MSKEKAEILRKLRELTAQDPVIRVAKINAVDEQACSCTVEIESLEYNARLTAAENSIKGHMIVPGIGSYVLVARIDEYGDVWVVIAFTRVTKIILLGGENGGLVLSGALVEKINTIEESLNDLKQILSAWMPVPQDGGAALKTAITNWAAQQITLTTTVEIENENIIQ